MAIIRITPDGTVERLDCGVELRALQLALGGHIEDAGEFIYIDDGDIDSASGSSYQLLVDEEGKLKSLPENELATLMCECFPFDTLCGAVLIVKMAYDQEAEGFDFAEIDDEACAAIIDYIETLRKELH